MKSEKFIFVFVFVIVSSCIGGNKEAQKDNRWGVSDTASVSSTLQLDDIIQNGEMIVATLNGPDTYYEYHGKSLGLHYLLLEKFCQKIGVSLRVEICKDTSEILRRIEAGDADIAAMPFSGKIEGFRKCAQKASGGKWYWLVNQDNTSLADSISSWLVADCIKKTAEEEQYWLSPRSVKRHVYSPFLDRSHGVISQYDGLFQKYSPTAGWDWKLLAALCYQESTFDPQARSWVGACGLMQIMPGTADELGLSRDRIFQPEDNIAAAARYIAKLDGLFSDIPAPAERIKFVLASYNGGSYHVRDAMALARKNGRSPYQWNNVRDYILKLSQPEYYRDPVVKHGYMRGSETYNYVESIYARWMEYRGVPYTKSVVPAAPSSAEEASKKEATTNTVVAPNIPHRSTHERKKKYTL